MSFSSSTRPYFSLSVYVPTYQPAPPPPLVSTNFLLWTPNIRRMTQFVRLFILSDPLSHALRVEKEELSVTQFNYCMLHQIENSEDGTENNGQRK